jgi:ribosomal protein L13E
MYAFAAAAHQIHGKGYVSLVRFASRFREIDREFYGNGDIEYSMEDARRRLAQMGITISGDIALAKNTGNYTERHMEVKHNIAQATQAAGICATIAANDVWGWAEKRIRPVLELAQEHMHRYAREGEGFLLEYLEKLGFVIVDGRIVGFVDENDNPVRQKVEGL